VNFSSRVLMAFVLPGFIFILLAGLIPPNNYWYEVHVALEKMHEELRLPVVIIAVLAFSFLAGNVADAIRNTILEDWFEGFYPKPDKEWLNYFFRGEKEKVQQLDEFYYSYYQFEVNSGIWLVIFVVVRIFTVTFWPYSPGLEFVVPLWVQGIISIVIAGFLFWDAWLLRRDMRSLIMEIPESRGIPPTCNARVSRSTIHGVGVKAIEDIKKGAELFPDDDGKLIWVDESQLLLLPLSQAQWRLYFDFCIFKGKKCGCPLSFDNLTPAWYLNSPQKDQDANAECIERDGGFFFYAKCDISAGTEITVDYSTFSEDAWGWLMERAGVERHERS